MNSADFVENSLFKSFGDICFFKSSQSMKDMAMASFQEV